ncbi:gluconokinase [Methylobacterium sp. J-088]|uniref:gluconokinase n=1 Tax=Methylobacterium sp. J-088 TaxID=2836664 RepID=UPI001FBB0F40|nr:gluconokinase [Methylobacterium sp. J-088]MCJ2065103.1 gluconokinase [Methylobacterium sp. J-088]
MMSAGMFAHGTGTAAGDALVLVVMGVSGSGKSTVAALVAERLGWTFIDGDSFHGPENVAKMHAGHALDDADRAPWLVRIAAWIRARLAAGESAVVVCSALRRAYRDSLTGGSRRVRIVYLEGDRALIAGRLAARHGHFMSPLLLDSQFATLEAPGLDEHPIIVGIADPPAVVAERIVARLAQDSRVEQQGASR